MGQRQKISIVEGCGLKADARYITYLIIYISMVKKIYNLRTSECIHDHILLLKETRYIRKLQYQ